MRIVKEATDPVGILPWSPSSVPINQEPALQGHWKQHQQIAEMAQHLIKRYRRRVGLEEIWAIEIIVSCPSDLQKAEATIGWDAEVWYARMMLRCVLAPPLLEWVVVHELCELQRWRSALCFLDAHQLLLPGEQADRLMEQFHQQRNQEIELQVASLLGHRRPYHLVEIP